MIAFDLICSNGHKFEFWFANSGSFEQAKACGMLRCPVCNDNQVDKAISTFAIKKYSDRKEPKKEEKIDPRQAYQVLQVITDYVNKNFEDVGVNFAKEALKIHFGEGEKRNIKGVALPQEEKILQEEGVQFLKLPVLKQLDN